MEVKILTGLFAVSKGKYGIRLVYDATKCGLNDELWAPNFGLLTINTLLNNSEETTWFAYLDLG